MRANFDPEEILGVCKGSEDGRGHYAKDKKLGHRRIGKAGGEHVEWTNLLLASSWVSSRGR